MFKQIKPGLAVKKSTWSSIKNFLKLSEQRCQIDFKFIPDNHFKIPYKYPKLLEISRLHEKRCQLSSAIYTQVFYFDVRLQSLVARFGGGRAKHH